MLLDQLDIITWKEKDNWGTDFIYLTKINLKGIIDLSVEHTNMKLLESGTEKNLDDLEFGDYFLNITLKAQLIKIDELEFIKLTCFVKDIIKRMKWQATVISDNDCYPNYT